LPDAKQFGDAEFFSLKYSHKPLRQIGSLFSAAS
jgi:hypothetical protein